MLFNVMNTSIDVMRPLACALLALTSAACSGGATARAHAVERIGVAMGSELRLSAWTAEEQAAHAGFAAAFAEFEQLEALVCVVRRGSDVLGINAAAGGRPEAVGAEVR